MKVLPHERGEAYWRKYAKQHVKDSTYRMRRLRGMSAMEAATRSVRKVTPRKRESKSGEE